MENDQIVPSFLSIFTLIIFFIFLITSKFSFKIKNASLLDQDFLKPQAFHKFATSRAGGLASIISLVKYNVLIKNVPKPIATSNTRV